MKDSKRYRDGGQVGPRPGEDAMRVEPVGTNSRDAALTSIAVSLKRLADVAERLAPKSGDDAHIEITAFVQHLGWEAGRSFQQGTRTDR